MFFGDTADFQFQEFVLQTLFRLSIFSEENIWQPLAKVRRYFFTLWRDKLGTKKLPEEFYGSFFLRVPGICPRKGQIRN